MKKLLVLLSLFLLAGLTACEKEVKTGEESVENTVESGESEVKPEPVDEYVGWKTYENSDLGISFKYPEGEVGFYDKVSERDTGKRVVIAVKGIYMIITSADYAVGVGEGCCYYYTGKSLDMNLSDAEAKAEIEKQFGEVLEFQRHAEFGGFSFIRMNQYVSVNPIYSALIPFKQGGDYANILLEGPDMGHFTTGHSSPDMERALDYINNQKYKEDSDYQNKAEVFEKILSSFKLI